VASWPAVQAFLQNHFTRGAITGVGVVNLCAGLAEFAGLFVSRHGR
jgi:hypothetical protein